MKRGAFTMVELVFVIVILGILSSVAITKLAASREDAEFVAYKSDISTIRSAINQKRSVNLLAGNNSFPDLNKASHSGPSSTVLFDNILDYPVKASNKKGWGAGANDNEVILRFDRSAITFNYDQASGIFTCVGFNNASVKAKKNCEELSY